MTSAWVRARRSRGEASRGLPIGVAANVIVLAIIVKRAVEQKKNPYTNEIFTDLKDFKLAMARAEEQ